MPKTPTGAYRPADINNNVRVTESEFERLKLLEQETREKIKGFRAEPLVPREELHDRNLGRQR